MRKNLSIILTVCLILSLTFALPLGALADGKPTAAKFTKIEGATDMSVVDTAAGVKLKATGTYEFDKQFSYTDELALDGLTVELSDMNTSSTAWTQVGQGGNAFLIHAVDNPVQGIIVELHYNVHGNSTGKIYDTNGTTFYEGVQGLFWGVIPGVPKNNLKLTLKKEATGSYTLGLSTTVFGNAHPDVGDGTAPPISVTIPAATATALFGADAKAKVAVAAYFQPTANNPGESEVDITKIAPLYVAPAPGGDDDDDDDDTTDMSTLVEKLGNGMVTKTDDGVKLNSNGTFEFEEGFKLTKAYKPDGFSVEFIDMNIGESSYNRDGQGGLKIVLASGTDANKAIIIEQHFNVFGNSQGKIYDTNGKEYLVAMGNDLLWGENTGCVPKADLTVKLEKQANSDYLLTLSTKSLGKKLDDGTLQDIGDSSIKVKITAAEFKTIFGDEPSVAMSFMPYYQKPANTPAGAEMVIKAILGEVAGANNGGNGNNGNGNGNGVDGGGTKPKTPSDTGENFPVAAVTVAVVSILLAIVVLKKRQIN